MTVIDEGRTVQFRTFKRLPLESVQTWNIAPAAFVTPVELQDSRLPVSLVERYVKQALNRAVAETMEDGRIFLTVPALHDLWADGDTEAEAEVGLREVIQQWVDMKLSAGEHDLPVIGGVDLNPIRL